jgi:transposase-like protein
MSQKYGSNATGLARVLNLSPLTTWNILHKLRGAMVRDEREKLGPVVEVDESFIGGAEKGKPGRGAEKKALIILAVELSSDEKTMGRIRLAFIPDAIGDSVVPFVETNVEPGSKVVTDGWTGYLSLKTKWFSHEIKPMRGDEDMVPRDYRVFSLLKRWLLGT